MDDIDFSAGLGSTPPRLPTPTPDCSGIINEIDEASAKGDLSAVRQAYSRLRSAPGGDRWLTSAGSGPYFAVQNRHAHIVEYFLREGVQINPWSVKVATTQKDKIILQMYLQNGWDINKEISRVTPAALSFAIEDMDLTAWFLTRGADPNARCQSGISPLNTALEAAPLDVIKMLLRHGSTSLAGPAGINHVVRRDTGDQLEVLQYVLDNGGRALVNHVLYQDDPFWYRMQEAFGLGTALHEAASYGKVQMARLLVENGADLTIKDSLGRTALQRAEKNNHPEIVNYLRRVSREGAAQL
ncbi:MAG: hypothetical protein M1820_009062 [Bogoriella megaspora]|nr:MAG: hypothetical protein M1820_009062 [Bogoriella megaspora]